MKQLHIKILILILVFSFLSIGILYFWADAKVDDLHVESPIANSPLPQLPEHGQAFFSKQHKAFEEWRHMVQNVKRPITSDEFMEGSVMYGDMFMDQSPYIYSAEMYDWANANSGKMMEPIKGAIAKLDAIHSFLPLYILSAAKKIGFSPIVIKNAMGQEMIHENIIGKYYTLSFRYVATSAALGDEEALKFIEDHLKLTSWESLKCYASLNDDRKERHAWVYNIFSDSVSFLPPKIGLGLIDKFEPDINVSQKRLNFIAAINKNIDYITYHREVFVNGYLANGFHDYVQAYGVGAVPRTSTVVNKPGDLKPQPEEK